MGASILSASGPREGGSETEGRQITRCVNVKVLAVRTLGEAVLNIQKCPPPSSQGAGVFMQHPLSALAEGPSRDPPVAREWTQVGDTGSC